MTFPPGSTEAKVMATMVLEFASISVTPAESVAVRCLPSGPRYVAELMSADIGSVPVSILTVTYSASDWTDL